MKCDLLRDGCPPGGCDFCIAVEKLSHSNELHEELSRLQKNIGEWDDKARMAWKVGILSQRLSKLKAASLKRDPIRILIADDDDDLKMWLQKILVSEGYDVEFASDGQAALEHLRRGGIDLLLTDQQMPGLTGLMLLEKARRQWPMLPVIMMTADPSQTLTIGALREGATDFIPKPLDKGCLLVRLHRVLAGVEAEHELARSQSILLERERSLAALFRNLPGSAYRCRCQGGVFQMDIISEGTNIIGSPEENIWNPETAFTDLIHPDDIETWREIRMQADLGEGFTHTFRIINPKNELRWIVEKGTVIAAEKGVQLIEGFMMDITDQKMKEEELAQAEIARQAAEHARRQEREFMANMSHEMRTPLQTLLTTLRTFMQEEVDTIEELISQASKLCPQNHGELSTILARLLSPLLDEFDDDITKIARLKSDLTNAVEAGNRLARTINGVLDLAKLSSGRIRFSYEEQDLCALIHSVETEFRSAASKKRIQMIIPHEDQHVAAMFDTTWMRQVLTNLVGNALKFTAEEGAIEIRCEDGDDEVGIMVMDNGSGIPPGEERLIFDRFAQSSATDKSGGLGGTGLGLSLCLEIVSRHGGRIWAENLPQGGAVFRVKLPKHQSPQPEPAMP